MKYSNLMARCLAAILSITLLCPSAVARENTPSADMQTKSGANMQEQVAGSKQTPVKDNVPKYSVYIGGHAAEAKPADNILLTADQLVKSKTGLPEVASVGEESRAVVCGEDQSATWSFTVEEQGLYTVEIRYYPLEGKGIDIERSLMIDGKLPFGEMRSVKFPRIWASRNTEEWYDSNGNQVRASLKETPVWSDMKIRSDTGEYVEPFSFYLTRGEHSLTLGYIQESMAVAQIRLTNEAPPESYAEYIAAHKAQGAKTVDGYYDEVQGEDAGLRSGQILYPLSDRSSPLTRPYSLSKIRYNYIGSTNWQNSGQWIEWKLTVPESGLYRLTLRYRQPYKSGMYSSRRLYINGEVPFAEMNNLQFAYGGGWNTRTLSDSGGQPYWFYLSADRPNVLRMECTVGDISENILSLNESIATLNTLYLQVIMLTSAEPDLFRDYEFEKHIPGFRDTLRSESARLLEQKQKIEQIAGKSGSELAVMEELSIQLDSIAKKPYTIAERLTEFRDNISAFSAMLYGLAQQPLDIDCIAVRSADKGSPRSDINFFERIVHEVKLLVISFIEDYSSIGVTANVRTEDAITVWVPAGRDQANVLRQIIDEMFVSKYHIGVNLRVINTNVLMPAIVAGKGPDVVIQAGRDIAVNYGVRGALADLTRFNNFAEVERRFNKSVTVPLGFGGAMYALPETESFYVLFYRTDVFDLLRLPVPATWEEVYAVAGKLKKANLEFGIPYDLHVFASLLFQNGGRFYNDDLSRSMLDDEPAIQAFTEWTEMKTLYNFPLAFSFITRFKSGEMPIGIADFTVSNVLSVSAPEIKGLWEMAMLPGKPGKNGLDHSTTSTGTAAFMVGSTKTPDSAWRFLDWWTGEEAQRRYGIEIENLLGASARYASANRKAMDALPWTNKQMNIIGAMRDWVIPIEEVPGGYFTYRHLNNALRKSIYKVKEPRSTLVDYVEIINSEIAYKREELNLGTPKP